MSKLHFLHSGGDKVTLTTPASNPSTNPVFKLPQTDGSAGQVLKTDGNGNLSWVTPASTNGITVADCSDILHSYSTITLNTGSVWDNSNGRFTAPVTGLYQFGFTIYDGTSNGNIRNANLLAYDSSMNLLLGDSLVRENHENPAAGSTTFSCSCIAPLDATNRVYLTFNGSVAGSTPRNVFYGYLIGH